MADIYKIGVTIAMKDNATAVLQALSKHVVGLNMSVEQLQGGFNRAKLAALGFTGVIGGTAMLAGMAKLADAGKEFAHQQSLMYQAGLSQVEVAQATGAAWQTAGNVIGSSAEKNIALVADLRNQLGSMKEAIAVMPQMAQMGVVLSNLTGRDQEQSAFTAVRYLDQRGALVDPNTHEISASHLTQQARLLEGIAIGSRGRVGPEQLLAFQQYARTAGAALSDRGLINLAPVIAASGSASTVGTQLASLQQQLAGGIMTQAGATWLENLGLMDAKKVHVGRGGHLTIDRGALAGGDEMRADPVSWVRDYLSKALQKSGFATTDSQMAELLRSHLRGTVIGLLSEILRNQPAFDRDAQNIQRAVGVDQYKVANATDPTTKLNAFENAWHNLLTALGAPLVNDATGMLAKLTAGITKLTDFTRRHPRAVEDLEMLAAGTAAFVALAGGMALTAAALGPLVSGVAALGSVMAGASVAAAIPAMAAFAAGAGALAATLAAAGGILYGTHKLAGWAKSEDHKLGYDDGSPITWKDKLDPFQWFHTHVGSPASAPQAHVNDPFATAWQSVPIWQQAQASRAQERQTPSTQPQPQPQQFVIRPAPVMLDGKKIGDIMFNVEYGRAMQDLRAQGSYADGVGNPRMPGMAFVN
ncbi:hypothetical protein J2D73_18475 [Acetobacter sacchari]|uniref:Phage tail tape measure protein domain-containing protein n=1 Tax=Acetobacter sacchari TaxID=2661687 RepID=A0ABS3M0Z4_9PROT|nr:hypothetical protein [Acetobacter sacchari]MBO1361771.1 hypothetical protein [Acetobacter sacchari]